MARVTSDQERHMGEIRAQEIRGRYDIGGGPVPDIFGLVESEGVLLVRYPSGNSNLHAFYAIIDKMPVIFVNSDETLGRQAFSVAHELYHLLYDSGTRSEIQCSPGADTGDPRETVADVFAGEFLLPRGGVRYEYTRRFGEEKPNEVHVIRLMQTFRVSYHAMVYALYRAGLFAGVKQYRQIRSAFSKDAGERLRDSIRKLGYPTDLVEPTGPECPQRFLEAVISNHERGLITYAKLRSLLGPWNRSPEEFGIIEDDPSRLW